MLVIKKDICIDEYIARMGTNVPTYDNGSVIYEKSDSYTDWGRVPLDINIETGGDYADLIKISDKLPLSIISIISDVTGYITITDDNTTSKTVDKTSGGNRYVLKYKVMSNRYASLKKIMREARYYRSCLRGSEYKWVEISEDFWYKDFGVSFNNDDGTENENINYDKFFAKKKSTTSPYNWVMSSETPSTSIITGGDTIYCCVFGDYEEFTGYFRKDGDNTRYEKTFYDLVETLFTDSVSGFTFSDEYINLQLCLTEDINNIGSYTPYIQEWIPNKRFYVGEYVHYVLDEENDPYGNTYTLDEDADGLSKEWVEVTYDDFYAIKENPETSDKCEMKNGKYGINVYYYKGYFDEAIHATYFDELDSYTGEIWTDGNGNTKHWKLCTASDITPISDVISGITGSYLKTLQRKKQSFDNEGNELPFVIDDKVSNNTELKYLLGPCNMEVDGNYTISDLLQSVDFYTSGSSQPSFSYTYDSSVPVSAITAIDTKRPSNCQYVGFQYYNDCRVTDETVDTSTGVLHKEIYKFEVKTMCADVSDANSNFVWVVTGGTPDETVSKLPDMLVQNYGKVYQYDGVPSYTLKGDTVEIVEGNNVPTITNPSVGFIAIIRNNSVKNLYIYGVTTVQTDGTLTYGWIPATAKYGDAYQFVDTVYDSEAGKRKKTTRKHIYMFDGASTWLDMTYLYGSSKDLMAYNHETDSYEEIQTGKCYTLQAQFAYIDINYDKTYNWDSGLLGYEEDEEVVSRISFKGENTLHDEFQKVPIFHNDSVGSSVDIKSDISLNIERGTSAAYERHWILGETNTFQDLMEYKNNMFKL